jgi:hypothetical protein
MCAEPSRHAHVDCLPAATWRAPAATWPPLQGILASYRSDSNIRTSHAAPCLLHAAAGHWPPHALQQHARAVSALPRQAPFHLCPARRGYRNPPHSTLCPPNTGHLRSSESPPLSHIFPSTAAAVDSPPDGPSLIVSRSQRSPWTMRSSRTSRPCCWSAGAVAHRHCTSDHPPLFGDPSFREGSSSFLCSSVALIPYWLFRCHRSHARPHCRPPLSHHPAPPVSATLFYRRRLSVRMGP